MSEKQKSSAQAAREKLEKVDKFEDAIGIFRTYSFDPYSSIREHALLRAIVLAKTEKEARIILSCQKEATIKKKFLK